MRISIIIFFLSVFFSLELNASKCDGTASYLDTNPKLCLNLSAAELAYEDNTSTDAEDMFLHPLGFSNKGCWLVNANENNENKGTLAVENIMSKYGAKGELFRRMNCMLNSMVTVYYLKNDHVNLKVSRGNLKISGRQAYHAACNNLQGSSLARYYSDNKNEIDANTLGYATDLLDFCSSCKDELYEKEAKCEIKRLFLN